MKVGEFWNILKDIAQNNLGQAVVQGDEGVRPDDVTAVMVDCQNFNHLVVGSPNWCASLEQIVNKLSDLGRKVANAILPFDLDQFCAGNIRPNTPNAAPPTKVNWTDKLSPEAIASIPGEAIQAFTSIGPAMFKRTVASTLASLLGVLGADKKMIEDAVNNGDITALLTPFRESICKWYFILIKCNSCNPALVLGLSLLKTVLQFFKHLRGDVIAKVNFVIEGGVKIAFHLPFEIRPLERTLDYLLEYVCPVKIPSEGEIVEQALRNLITQEHALCLLKLHGFDPLHGRNIIWSKRHEWHWKDVLQWCRRRPDLNRDEIGELSKQGFIDGDDRNMARELFVELPTITDHLHFLARNADDWVYVAEFGLWWGFAEKQTVINILEEEARVPGKTQQDKQTIHDAIQIIEQQELPPTLQNRNFWAVFGPDLTAQGVSIRTAFFHYVSHWMLPAPEKGAEMVQRLRKGRVPDAISFSIDQYKKTLLEQDVSPSFIDRYLATAYHPYQVRQLHQLYEDGQIDFQEVIASLMDQGFDTDKATRIANSYERQRKLHLASQCNGYTVERVLKLYKQGAMARGTAGQKIVDLGFSEQDAANALVVYDREIFGDDLNLFIERMRNCFLHGIFTEQQVTKQMQIAGIDDARIQNRLIAWKQTLLCDQHHASVSQLLKWRKENLIGDAELLRRLLVLNLDSDTIRSVLLQAAHDQDIIQEKERDKLLKDRVHLARELDRQVKLNQRRMIRGLKIKLDLQKAYLKAQSTLQKAALKQQVTDAKQQAAEQKKADILDAREEIGKKVAEQKGKTLVKVAELKDKVEKAEVRADNLKELADLADQLREAIAQAGTPLVGVAEGLAGQSASALVQQEAGAILATAQADATIKNLENSTG